MKILTPQNFRTETNKMLANKSRWNNTLDDELCTSVLSNVYNPVLTQGIPVAPTTTIEVSGIQCTLYVIYNPYMVISRGWSIAGCLTDTISQIVVFVDDDFMRLTKSTQEFTIHHEIGHIEHGHPCLMRALKYELEADMYAAQHCNNGAEALQELGQYASSFMSKIEFTRRIKALR